jgi:hypothetical protein
VRDRDVHHQCPQRHERHPARELRTVGDRTADQCGGQDREGQLEGGEQQLGDRAVHCVRVDARHAEVVEVADQATARVLAEGEAVAGEQPDHGYQRDGDEVHHQHVEYAGRAHHPTVENGKSRCHQQHEGGTDEKPGGGRGIDG